jgi:hypothetical protein
VRGSVVGAQPAARLASLHRIGGHSDEWIERLARLFREHPAWRACARFVDRRATNNVFLSHRPGEAWHLERRGDTTLLQPGAAPDPDFVFRFPPGAIERLEAVRGGPGDFAVELFGLTLTRDPATRVDLRVAASFPRLLRRGYVRLLAAAGPRVLRLGAAHGVHGLAGLRELVLRLQSIAPAAWETECASAAPARLAPPPESDRG